MTPFGRGERQPSVKEYKKLYEEDKLGLAKDLLNRIHDGENATQRAFNTLMEINPGMITVIYGAREELPFVKRILPENAKPKNLKTKDLNLDQLTPAEKAALLYRFITYDLIPNGINWYDLDEDTQSQLETLKIEAQQAMRKQVVSKFSRGELEQEPGTQSNSPNFDDIKPFATKLEKYIQDIKNITEGITDK